MPAMKPKVYIETTIISYLAARPSRDLIVAAHQQLTHQWWDTSRASYDLWTSQEVIGECAKGDPAAAQQRLEVLAKIALAEIGASALDLAREFVESGAIPQEAAEDALHLGIAVTNGMEYLLTWNCRHLANARMRSQIDEVCERMGYKPIIICNPEELLET